MQEQNTIEETCTCGNQSNMGDIQMVNDEDLLYFCADCGKQLIDNISDQDE